MSYFGFVAGDYAEQWRIKTMIKAIKCKVCGEVLHDDIDLLEDGDRFIYYCVNIDCPEAFETVLDEST